MVKSFEKFVTAWNELATTGKKEINEATLTFFLVSNFGTSKNNFTHYKSLSLKLGFIEATKLHTYTVNAKAIENAFHSKVIK